jgi:hypothetical protein
VPSVRGRLSRRKQTDGAGTTTTTGPTEASPPQDPAYDQDDTYAPQDPDDIYAPQDQDDTYEPYDFLPALGPDPGLTPTPWYDEASRESRWAALREAAAPLEESPGKSSPTD